MATLANIFNNFTGAKTIADSAETTAVHIYNDAFKLRPLPNEDVFWSAKRIDNSAVVRQADPRARARDWKLVGGATLASLALIGMLLPSAYGLMAGYQISQLEQEHQRLTMESVRLELEEAELVSAERLQEQARIRTFIDAAPERTLYLPKSGHSLAFNRP